MTRFLALITTLGLATSVSADNLMTGVVEPLPRYWRIGEPAMRPNYVIWNGSPYFNTGPYSYGYSVPTSYGWARRTIGNVRPNVGAYGYGYHFYSMPYVYTNPWAYNTSYAYSIPSYYGVSWSNYVEPTFDNSLVTIPDSRPIHDSYSASNPNSGSAQVTMNVPADAEVWIQGTQTQQTGPVRTFVTPPLSGPANYEVKVRRNVDGQATEQTMNVMVRPGGQSSLHILQ